MNTKQQYKARKNFEFWLDEASNSEWEEGLGWYEEAMSWAYHLSERFNVSQVTSAGVISALSPNNRWGRNKLDAMSLLLALYEGRDIDSFKVCTYGANKRKAWEIAKGNVSILQKSPKTYAFAQNVGAKNVKFITLDKWMLRSIATRSSTPKPEVSTIITAKNYDILGDNLIKVANKRGLKPYEAQAIVWITIRNRWTHKNN